MINKIPQGIRVWGEFSILALIVMVPLLLPGYILTLDLVFTPHMAGPDISSSFPLEVVLWLLYHILPGDIVEKLILFGILVASGVGMHRFIQTITRPGHISSEAWRLAAFIAGIFYMINPFVYDRFMAGQWMVLLGYALVPFFVAALLLFLRHPSLRTSLTATLWAVVIGIVSLHHIGIILLISVGLVSGAIFHDRKQVSSYVKWGAAGIATWLIANCYWLIPLVLGGGSVSTAVAGFNDAHFNAFATVGGALSVVQLQGFWVEARQLFILPQQIMPLWGIVVLLLWGVIVYGATRLWQNSGKWIVIACASGILLATLLSATPLIAQLSQWLPIVAGYREPQKFVNILVISYAVLLACGAAYSIEAVRKVQDWRRDGVIGGLFLLPILLTPTMFGGFAGQLVPRTYPPEWYAANRLLKDDKSVKRVLFLPWHQYANYSFSGRLIANPAEKFFEVPVLISDDPEFKAISPTTPNEDKRRLTEALRQKELPLNLLRELGVSHIILAKEQEWREYTEKVSVVALRVQENDKLLVYKVRE